MTGSPGNTSLYSVGMTAQGNAMLTALIVTYRRALLGLLAITPLLVMAYLHYQQDPARLFEHHLFHIVAIMVAVLLGGFVSYVTWLCYRETGEPFLRWLTLGFLGFTLVYAPHGLLTPLAESNPWAFLLFGPASRLVMAVCFLLAMFHYDRAPDTTTTRRDGNFWWQAVGIFVLIDLLMLLWAYSPVSENAALRLGPEYTAIAIYMVIIVWLWQRRISNSLMLIYALSLAWFAQSSLAFTDGLPWNHQWWLAHLIFAGGFLLLSYGVVQSWLSTRSFAHVYNQAELLKQLRQEKQRAEQAIQDLQHANQALERLASTDALTGAANRRALIAQAEKEIARAGRHGTPLSLALLDLDYFKKINDRYGHPVGDAVLVEFVARTRKVLRTEDVLGRMGGEEFAIVLPETGNQDALKVAERLCDEIAGRPFSVEGVMIDLQFSGGVVGYMQDYKNVADWLRAADKVLYQAKAEGRNRVLTA